MMLLVGTVKKEFPVLFAKASGNSDTAVSFHPVHAANCRNGYRYRGKLGR